MIFPRHGSVGKSGAEGGERTRLSVQQEGHVIVDVAVIGDFGQCIVFVVAHQPARHVVARRAVGTVTIAGIHYGICLCIPRASNHRSHHLPHRRGEHIHSLVGSHVEREGNDILILHTIDGSNHVEAEQVRCLDILILSYVGNGDGYLHSHVLAGRKEHVACTVFIVCPCQRETMRAAEPCWFVEQTYVWPCLSVHGLEHDGLPATRRRERYHDAVGVSPGILLGTPVHGCHLVVTLHYDGICRQVYQLQTVILSHGGLPLDVKRDVGDALSHGSHQLVFLRILAVRCVRCFSIAVVAVPDAGDVAGGALHLQVAARADGFDGEIALAQFLVIVHSSTEVQVVLTLHHGDRGEEPVAVVFPLAAILAYRAIAANDITRWVDDGTV